MEVALMPDWLVLMSSVAVYIPDWISSSSLSSSCSLSVLV